MKTFAQLLVERRPFLTVLALCAMPEETRHLKEQMAKHGFLQSPNERFFRRGILVDVRTTGIGMVHAAANASMSMHTLQPDVIINVGCAGAHDPALYPGDVVVGEAQVSTSSVVVSDGDTMPYGDRESATLVYPSDETLVGMARKSRAPLTSFYENERRPTITVGKVASSDTWMDTRSGVVQLRKLFGTACEDMEAAAVAVVAHARSLPFLSLKDISNSVFVPFEETFDAVEHHVPPSAGRNAAIVAARLLRDVSEMTD